MVEVDYDLCNLIDMFILDRIVKIVFYMLGIVWV